MGEKITKWLYVVLNISSVSDCQKGEPPCCACMLKNLIIINAVLVKQFFAVEFFPYDRGICLWCSIYFSL